MNFIIETDLEKALPAVIDFNFEEMKTELTEKLKFYNSLVVTEESIKTGKEERAKLNKLEKAVNDKKIEVKKQCLAPYEEFEIKCKELIGMISGASSVIDTQIKAFEEAEKKKKLDAITDFYKTNVGILADILPLEKILNPKWANATVTLLSINQEMIDKIMTVKSDLKIIEDMKLENEVQVKDAYLKNLNMSEALSEKNRFEEQQKRLDEIKKSQAAQTAVSEPSLQAPAAVIANAEPQAEALTAVKTIKVIFYDTTPEFRSEMRELTLKHNIKYGGIQ